ncbi:MAG TPA: type II secretion system protein GspN [Desulfatiglandales bacterium]|nr:type II secretion system protein GspN [Desulfatiglandales bacterium]
MTRRTKTLFWTGLGIYGLLLSLMLTLYRLPVDKVLGKALTLFTETQTLVSAETVSFAFPLSYVLERITCEAYWPQGKSKDRMDSLYLGPEWSRAFSGSLPMKGEANFAQGRVEARLGVPLFSRGYLDAKAYVIHLEELSFLQILLDRRVSGKGEGELRLIGDVRFPADLNGRGFLRITDGSLESKLPLAGLRTIPFQSVSTFLVIQKGVLLLNDGKIEGPAISGSFSGEVKLDERMSRSLLNITARLTPGPMVNENELARQLAASLAEEGEPITIHLRGTLGSPSVRWEKE